jgi:Mg-chelatase subunit ChlD
MSTSRILIASLISAAAFAACGPVPAHDWPSPGGALPRSQQHPPQDEPGRWSGLLWQGPRSGAPAMPVASDCRRPPALFDLPGPVPPRRAWPRERLTGAAAPEARRDGAGAASADALAAERAAERVDPGGLRREAEAAAAPPAAAAPMADAFPAKRQSAPAPMMLPPPRPAHDPVTAGVVDDNADFGEFIAFMQRWRVPRRDIALHERVLLDVRDERGRPVPDALVTVSSHGRAVPLWARTDAGGRAWLMPQRDVHGEQFEVQVSKAGATSRAFWRRGQKDALQVRLDGAVPERARLDIVFAIDATGSMADEIDKLKSSMRAVADQIARLPSRPDLCFGLVAYRDRGDEFFVRGADLTSDLSAFQDTLGRLRAGGGGDYPEAMNEALHTAVHRIGWRGEGTARIVILLADAPPHLDYGAPHYEHDLRAASARGVKIFGVGASGLDRQGETIMRQMAQFTGGRFVFLTYEQARNPASGPGRETVHDVRNYSVETLDKLLVRLVSEEMARWPEAGG